MAMDSDSGRERQSNRMQGSNTCNYAVCAAGPHSHAPRGNAYSSKMWFKVKDPDKHVLIKDFENKLVDFSIAATCGATIDMTLTIYDENMQPWYEIKRVRIPTPDKTFAVSTTEFTLRATLIKNNITYNGDKVDYVGKIAQP